MQNQGHGQSRSTGFLLFRSASSLRTPRSVRRSGHGNALPIGNRRYSRLEACATLSCADFVIGSEDKMGPASFGIVG